MNRKTTDQRLDLIGDGVKHLLRRVGNVAQALAQADACFTEARRGLSPSHQLWDLCIDLEVLARRRHGVYSRDDAVFHEE